MAVNTKIIEAQRKVILNAEEIELFKQAFVIVPYQVSGFVDYTNKGAIDFPINPDDVETFKRLWTGNEAIILNWKNSLIYNGYAEELENNVYFQLGEVFLGNIETNDAQNMINKDTSFTDYTSQEVIKTVQFRVHKMFDITSYYQFMFYKIPEFSGSTLFRITNIERTYIGNILSGYVLSFESINQDLANTGTARQQNIMPNSPGQGYLECEVAPADWIPEEGLIDGKDYYKFFDKYIIANYQKTLNRPVHSVVVKAFGVGIISNVMFFGRKAKEGQALENYGIPRLIFPINLKPANTPNLYRSQNSEVNFYYGNFTPTLLYTKQLLQQIKDSFTPVNKWESQGALIYNKNDLEVSNADNSSLYNWSPNVPTEKINTSDILGCRDTYNAGGVKKIENHLWDNYWIEKEMLTMPMNKTTMLGYGSSLWAKASNLLTYNFWLGASLLVIGTSLFLAEKYKNRHFKGFRGIISKPLIDLNSSQYGDNSSLPIKERYLDFNILNNKSDSPSSIFFDSTTMTTSFEAGLTDSFTTTDTSVNQIRRNLNTSNIGQKQDEFGNYIMNDISFPYLISGVETLTKAKEDNKSYGFIIDGFKICSIFTGEFSIEFKDNNGDIIWTGFYQSQGKWTNSKREIWTEKTTSVFGKENMFFKDPLPYPKEIETDEQGKRIVLNHELTKLARTNVNYGDILYWNSRSHWGKLIGDRTPKIKMLVVKYGQFGINNKDDFLEKYTWVRKEYSESISYSDNAQFMRNAIIFYTSTDYQNVVKDDYFDAAIPNNYRKTSINKTQESTHHIKGWLKINRWIKLNVKQPNTEPKTEYKFFYEDDGVYLESTLTPADWPLNEGIPNFEYKLGWADIFLSGKFHWINYIRNVRYEIF